MTGKTLRKKKTSGPRNLHLVQIFCILVFFLVATSLVSKLIFLISQSTFDGEHRFTIAFLAKPVSIVSFSPDIRTISLLKAPNVTDLKRIGRMLEIPIDATVDVPHDLIAKENVREAIESSLQTLFFAQADLYTSLTPLDIVRLWWFTRSVSSHAVIFSEINLSSNKDDAYDTAIDKISSKLFLDNAISLEKVSLRVVNAAGIQGLGNRLARFLTNMGGNVVIVETADNQRETSEIVYYGKKTYTLKRLGEILQFPLIDQVSPGIADITIILGKDSSKLSKF